MNFNDLLMVMMFVLSILDLMVVIVLWAIKDDDIVAYFKW